MILVDFDMLAHRCYRAMDGLLSSTTQATGMEYGVCRTLKGLCKRIAGNEKHKVVLCLEGGGGTERPSFYKANRRKPPSSFYCRKDILIENLKQVYYWAQLPGHEADQVMYSLSLKYAPLFIYTNDSDMYQAIRELVIVVRSYESQLFYWDAETLFEKYKVRPWQYAFYKTLTGDKTDNIPGIPRINRQLAAEIARRTYNHYLKKAPGPSIALAICIDEFLSKVSDKMRKSLVEFTLHQLKPNFDLIQLKAKLDVKIVEPGKNSIQKYLDSLEIKSITFDDETEF